MKRIFFMLGMLAATTAFQACDSGNNSEADQDAAKKRANKGENAREVQD